ncbi:MAG: helix-turn-helix transcriptional regulator [Mycobacterium sp.]
MSDSTADVFSPEAFRQAITRSGLKGQQLADVLELRPNHISRLRAGKTSPSLDVLNRIAAGLGGTVADYLNLPPRGRWQLRHYRLAAGVTQLVVADHVGVDQTAVAKWEVLKTRPSDTAVTSLATLYRTTPRELHEAIDRAHTGPSAQVLALAEDVCALAQIGVQTANQDAARLADIRARIISTLSILDGTREQFADATLAARAHRIVDALARLLGDAVPESSTPSVVRQQSTAGRD